MFDKGFNARQEIASISKLQYGGSRKIRLDNADPFWKLTAERPWDPPLADSGKARAFSVGKILKNNLSVRIDRVVVSPFIRCVETALEIVSALCTINDSPNYMDIDEVFDPSKVKVSIENGLCEVSNRINLPSAPEKGEIGFNFSKLEALFPAGTLNQKAEPICEKLPQWEEPSEAAKIRYAMVIRAIANKYPLENILLVTHKIGVKAAVSAFMENIFVYEVNCCGYSHLKRQISFNPSESLLLPESTR
ncbi:hypothetical protein IFM89_002047 [Coptis chinensis]|uniref:Uncharacterized protein n=1 Tax=Coptis chinensis TaxID=261450 RepID=A0A835HAY0_9MAGN|nr:hypothetical protein IFM89_002047 [Coptis chinensis]